MSYQKEKIMFKFIFLFLVSFNCFAFDSIPFDAPAKTAPSTKRFFSFDEWSRADRQREAVFVAVAALDWLTTRNMARNCSETYKAGAYYENNSILGRCPSLGRVNGYFASMVVLHAGIVTALPSNYRAGFQWTSLAYEFSFGYGNIQAGLSAKF
jgi:hypothetical protein